MGKHATYPAAGSNMYTHDIHTNIECGNELYLEDGTYPTLCLHIYHTLRFLNCTNGPLWTVMYASTI